MAARKLVPSIRLLPLTMLMAVLILGVKVSDIYNGTHQVAVALGRSAQAEEEAPASNKKPAPKEAKKEPAEDAQDAKEEAKSEPGDAAEEDQEDAEKPDDKAADAEEKTKDAKPKQKKEYTQIELDILQSLSKRREEIDAYEKQVKLKEQMLGATEQRLNDKIDDLKKLQATVDGLLKEYTMHQDSQVESLVKIYENMKPVDAAAIFNEMDMPILLKVIDKMKERKVSPILAQMSPGKAKDITQELAESHKMRPELEQAAAGAPPAKK